MTSFSKLPEVGTTIFTVMSALAQQHGAINLSQGFPNFEVDPKLIELAKKSLALGNNQYAPMKGHPKLLEAIRALVKTSYAKDVSIENEITVTAGATQAIYTAITALVNVNDEVIVFEPCYDCYAPAIQLNGAKVVPIALLQPNYTINWQSVENAITAATKMIIVNSPHNPSGSVLSQTDLLELQRLAQKYDLIVLSDEVYEHIIFDDKTHQSILRFNELAQRSVVVSSFGKTFHATGWKIGYAIAPEHLMQEFKKVHQFLVFSVNTPLQLALAQYIEDKHTYLTLHKLYEEKRNYFLELTSPSRFKFLPSSGTYFQLADYSAISQENDVAFAKRITKAFKVASIPVSVFYHNKQDNKQVRFCFAKTHETLEKAAEIICKI